MDKEIQVLQEWIRIINTHKKSVSCFLESSHSICNEYERVKQQQKDNQFNIFSIVSDLYYRENFHSDIIRFFLDTQEKHGYRDIFVNLFISMLNKTGKSIDPSNYYDAVAIREEGKIDILIKSETSKRAIIIENKINNAGDMQRQIPRYYDYVSPNYIIDAIVYLPLDRNKQPDKSDWSEKDKENVDNKDVNKKLLIIIPAIDEIHRVSLVNNWLIPSELAIDNIDIISTLRQYSQLIIKLNTSIMDTTILEKFYKELKVGDNLKTAQSIRNMLNELPNYLAIRIKEKFESCCSPFSKIWIYKSTDAVFEGALIRGLYLKIDIWCYENRYDVLFWAREEDDETVFYKIVSDINSLADFTKKIDTKNQIIKHFNFNDEEGLFVFIDSILHEMRKLA